LSVYAHTPGKGWWYKQVTVTASTSAAAPPSAPGPASVAPPVVSGGAPPIVVTEQPTSGQKIKTRQAVATIIGYALDKNAAPEQGVQGSGIDRVSLYVDKERDNGGTSLGDAELAFSDQAAASAYGSQFATSGWRLDFKPTTLHSGSHTLFVYAHSAVTNKESLETVGFTIAE
jgi:hypothetical protein